MKHNDTERRSQAQRFLKSFILVLLVALLCLGSFCVCFLLGQNVSDQLEMSAIFNVPQSTLVYDAQGDLVANLYGTENRIWVKIENIPEHVKNAFIAAEDIRFYTHSGIDIKRILGALIADVKAGAYVQGASTITQQLIKNSMLTRQKTLTRKMTEALLALVMERRYSKNEILEMYLNYTFFGAGAYGIEAAAQTYFSVSACDLSVEQAATLAAILKSPTYYAPHKYPENSLARRNAILSLMAGNGLLDEEQAQKAAETDLSLNMQVNNNEGSWYLDAAIDEACELLDLTWQEVTEGGYRIYTGLDRELQEACDLAFSNEDLFPKNAKDGSQPQAALICTEPSTGRISAVVGGRAYSVRRGLNRAIRARRQPGSCIKPILVYAPALQNRVITPATIFVDEAKTFDSYAPANYNNKYYGTVTARTALIKSLNIPAVEILSRNGINSSVSFAKNLGIPFEESDIGLSLALGGFQSGVTPLELCGAYSALASMGVYINPHFITRIESADGKIIYQAKEKGYT
ncbi:MAG: transglycosylase domain-containing protein, partial [Clostridia bacterium]|nr:transglycosylase domain-containing protein [Clostridia bacterium]